MKATDQTAQQHSPATEPWPEGTVARYLTQEHASECRALPRPAVTE